MVLQGWTGCARRRTKYVPTEDEDIVANLKLEGLEVSVAEWQTVPFTRLRCKGQCGCEASAGREKRGVRIPVGYHDGSMSETYFSGWNRFSRRWAFVPFWGVVISIYRYPEVNSSVYLPSGMAFLPFLRDS